MFYSFASPTDTWQSAVNTSVSPLEWVYINRNITAPKRDAYYHPHSYIAESLASIHGLNYKQRRGIYKSAAVRRNKRFRFRPWMVKCIYLYKAREKIHIHALREDS